MEKILRKKYDKKKTTKDVIQITIQIQIYDLDLGVIEITKGRSRNVLFIVRTEGSKQKNRRIEEEQKERNIKTGENRIEENKIEGKQIGRRGEEQKKNRTEGNKMEGEQKNRIEQKERRIEGE